MPGVLSRIQPKLLSSQASLLRSVANFTIEGSDARYGVTVYTYTMALNIKNQEVERLASEVAKITHVSKTEAIRIALEERRARLDQDQIDRAKETLRWLRTEVWPRVPNEVRQPMTRGEENEVLGYGSDGI